MPPLNRLFYLAKPLIPRRLQILMRRRLAGYQRKKFAHVWPIDPKCATPPVDWRGWPDGKSFALVLCHDVDTIRGYNNVLKLAELEEKMGFRSCFSFVPELYGRISLDLLDELRRRGFDVAVHGLKHDGKLFQSRGGFLRQAARINCYLREWRTAGFTSPSMHHNLEWIGTLNIQYSISTFDTDPFEPQPDGVGTIFPFAVRRNGIQGSRFKVRGSPVDCCSGELSAMSYELSDFFIELPYTLPQDSTLFIILQEKTNDIWKRKLDWIAQNSGMALVKVHPDYLNFDDTKLGREKYPAKYYEDFLKFVDERFKGVYWHCRPRDLALFVSRSHVGSMLRT